MEKIEARVKNIYHPNFQTTLDLQFLISEVKRLKHERDTKDGELVALQQWMYEKFQQCDDEIKRLRDLLFRKEGR